MKAVRLTAVNHPLELQEIPIPDITDTDILVKVKAAGICHSDAHYRAGISPVSFTPITLGHEVAGIVEKTGKNVTSVRVGDRVSLHYLLTCGDCYYCASGHEQFCAKGKMIGHHVDGGYAEYITVPARNAILLPDEIPFEQGATLMCASATAFHSLMKSRIKPGDRVAIFGVGGLGQSAVQLARAFGAIDVFAIDINEEKLDFAAGYGAIPINGKNMDVVKEIKNKTGGRGVDVAVEMIGLPQTQKQAIQCAGPLGRVVMVGLSGKSIEVNTYTEVLGNEVEIIGSNDHLLHELPVLVEFARKKILDTSKIVTRTIPLDAGEINHVLDAMDNFNSKAIRTVIVMD